MPGGAYKSGTYMFHVDRAIGQFLKRLVSITALKGGHVEHSRFQNCPIARTT